MPKVCIEEQYVTQPDWTSEETRKNLTLTREQCQETREHPKKKKRPVLLNTKQETETKDERNKY